MIAAWRATVEGLCFTPLTTDRHRRIGTRERVLDVAARYPDRLRIELHALATRVVLDGNGASASSIARVNEYIVRIPRLRQARRTMRCLAAAR